VLLEDKMKYKNISNKIKSFKIDGSWLTILPGMVFSIKKTFGRLHFDKDLEVVDKVPKIEEPQEGDNEEEKKDVIEEKKPIELKSREELKKLTRDQLNDYASDIGFKTEIKTSLLKSKMVDKILKLQGTLKK